MAVTSSAASRAKNAVAKTNETPSVRAQISAMESEFSKALPKGAEAVRFIRDAMTVISASPKLAQVQDPKSLLGALMTCAQLGLRPGVGALGEAYILPMKNKGVMTAQFILGYQGMTTLAHRSGMLDSVIARTVHKNDVFKIAYGTEDQIVHEPPVTGPRGETIGYYGVVKVRGGGYVFEYLSIEDMRIHRDKFALAKNFKTQEIVGPWKSDFDAMAKKTMIRKLWPYMPRSTEMQLAAAADNTVRLNIDPTADVADVVEEQVADEYIDGTWNDPAQQQGGDPFPNDGAPYSNEQ